jgi:DNA-directed RNA polymerase subunit N (RpoN/RPB10)
MIIPIRCTCGKPIAHLYNKYIEYIRDEEEQDPQNAASVNISRQTFLEKTLGLKRYCCKIQITTSTNLMDKI